MTRKDYEEADYVIAMDEENLDDLSRLTQGDPEKNLPPLTGREKQEMWRTPGIREILRKPMRILPKAAGRCWRSFPEPLLPLTDSGPRERNESEKFLFHVTSLYFRTGFLSVHFLV